jgi:hypothetical protein
MSQAQLLEAIDRHRNLVPDTNLQIALYRWLLAQAQRGTLTQEGEGP